MAYGSYEGKEISDPELRKHFDREAIITSNWYAERLKLKQQKDIRFYEGQISYLENFISNATNELIVTEMDIVNRLKKVKAAYAEVTSDTYVESLIGTIGADPLFVKDAAVNVAEMNLAEMN